MIRSALEALVAKLDAVHADPNYQGVWTLAHVHGVEYRGPKYGKELEAARAALQASGVGPAPNCCASCRGFYHDNAPEPKLTECWWQDPGLDVETGAFTTRGYICDQCILVHWAVAVRDDG